MCIYAIISSTWGGWNKNIKFNEKLINRIVSGGLSVVLLVSGYAFGKFESKSEDNLVSEYLEEYSSQRLELEKEIDKLLMKKEKLQQEDVQNKKVVINERFLMERLIVIEYTNADEQPDLAILEECSSKIFLEYHNYFKAWYMPHPVTEEHIADFCSNYVHFYESQPLYYYLTDEEIDNLTYNNGRITTLELDKILARIRSEYQSKLSEKNSSRTLTNN